MKAHQVATLSALKKLFLSETEREFNFLQNIYYRLLHDKLFFLSLLSLSLSPSFCAKFDAINQDFNVNPIFSPNAAYFEMLSYFLRRSRTPF
jgi:hypothetical protein